jgi:L-asparaginase II
LVETTRGLPGARAVRENIHHGIVAVVDTAGRLLLSAGNAGEVCFTRSTLKPLQALPLLADGGLERFGLGPEELALICASHSGEPRHVEIVSKILASIGLGEPDLGCGSHVPLHYGACGETPPPGAQWTQLHNNCSGKHSGFLAWCCLHGLSYANYLDFGHPLQKRIREVVGSFSAIDTDALRAGLDGCSAPNYALPLSSLAHLYARLAQGAADPEYGDCFGPIFEAMTGYPELVSGMQRTDLAFMGAAKGDWISKAGADGLQVLGSRSAGLGIAVKIADGSPRALQVAFVEALRQVGLLSDQPEAHFEAWQHAVIRNHRGTITGRVEPIFTLGKPD